MGYRSSRTAIALAVAIAATFSCSGCYVPLHTWSVPASNLPDAFRTPTRSVAPKLNLAHLTVPPPKDYTLGPNDSLDVIVPGLYEASETRPIRVRILGDGSITLPLVGDIQLQGTNLREAQTRINDAYADGFLDEPQASVVLAERETVSITVLGEVARPGVYLLPKFENDIAHAIAQAGGLTEFAAEVIEVHRRRVPNNVAATPPAHSLFPCPPISRRDRGMRFMQKAKRNEVRLVRFSQAHPTSIKRLPSVVDEPSWVERMPAAVATDDERLKEIVRRELRAIMQDAEPPTAAIQQPVSRVEPAHVSRPPLHQPTVSQPTYRSRVTNQWNPVELNPPDFPDKRLPERSLWQGAPSGRSLPRHWTSQDEDAAAPNPEPEPESPSDRVVPSEELMPPRENPMEDMLMQDPEMQDSPMQPLPTPNESTNQPPGEKIVLSIPLRGGTPSVSTPNYTLAQELTAHDVQLRPDDVVYVPRRPEQVFFVVGPLSRSNVVNFRLQLQDRQLGNAFLLPPDRDIDVVTAVAMAGYIDPIESPSTVTVQRNVPCGPPLLIGVDLMAARYDWQENVYVQPGDIIYLNPDARWYFRRTFDRVVPTFITSPYTNAMQRWINPRAN